MIISDLIKELREKEIEISFSAGKLKFSGPKENITPELIKKLKMNKVKLIRYCWPKNLGNLMPINSKGSKIPLFIVHGDNANYIVSDYLGTDQPVYGFFHPGSNGGTIPYRNIVQMAKAYLDKVVIVNPTGPFYLMGFSLGGVLAYEMAIQLKKMGHEVPFLVIIDSNSPLASERINWEDNFFKIIKKKILSPINRNLKQGIKLLIYESYQLFNKPVPVKKRKNYLYYKYLRLARSYSPGKFDGDILLFRATENQSLYKYLGWDTLVNRIRLVEIEGKHLEIFISKKRTNILQKEIERYLANVKGLI